MALKMCSLNYSEKLKLVCSFMNCKEIHDIHEMFEILAFFLIGSR